MTQPLRCPSPRIADATCAIITRNTYQPMSRNGIPVRSATGQSPTTIKAIETIALVMSQPAPVPFGLTGFLSSIGSPRCTAAAAMSRLNK